MSSEMTKAQLVWNAKVKSILIRLEHERRERIRSKRPTTLSPEVVAMIHAHRKKFQLDNKNK